VRHITIPMTTAQSIARTWLDAERTRRGNASRPRTQAYQRAVGRQEGVAEVARCRGWVRGTGYVEAMGRKTLKALPVAPGPDWLNEATTHMAELLQAEAER